MFSPTWDGTDKARWGKEFSDVAITGENNDSQHAYFLASKGEDPKPLLLSLHTWSGNYRQKDPLADMAMKADWNYIHPDFGGSNDNPDGCLSEKALAGMDDAISYAIEHGNVDPQRILVSGVSGGGYAALGLYLKTRHRINAFVTWVPISDLSAWYYQSKAKRQKYARDIEKCISADQIFAPRAAADRSPLHWNVSNVPASRLEIYAGINDGHTGSVPVSQSILFFNKMIKVLGLPEQAIDTDDAASLLTRSLDPSIDHGEIGGRKLVYVRNAGPLSLSIFEGAHEALPDYAFSRLRQLAEHAIPTDVSASHRP